MREDSLILKYRKAMKQKSNARIEEKNKRGQRSAGF